MERADFENTLLHELKLLRDTLHEQIEQQKNTTRALLRLIEKMEGIAIDIGELNMDVAAIRRGGD